MGTSGSSPGPGSGTPLLPTWIDSDSEILEKPAEQDDSPAAFPVLEPLPKIEPPPSEDRFRVARRSFNNFLKSGGQFPSSIQRAASEWVRVSTGGGKRAARRMGASRVAAARLLGVLAGVQQNGVAPILALLNLSHLINRPLADVLLGITDVICPAGGPIDDGIARYAWLETVADLVSRGMEDLDNLNGSQLRTILIVFVSKAIVARIVNDIGTREIALPSEIEIIADIQAKLEAYVQRAVDDAFPSDMNSLDLVTPENATEAMGSILQTAFELLEAMGAAA